MKNAIIVSGTFAAVMCTIGVLASQAADHDHHHHAAAGITVKEPWTRPVANVGGVGVGYGTISNGSETADELLSATSDAAERVELHETTINADGVASMKKIDQLPIAAGQTVELKPGGKHIMFIGLKESVKDGDAVNAKLHFKNGGEVTVDFKARKTDAPAEPDHHEHHH